MYEKLAEMLKKNIPITQISYEVDLLRNTIMGLGMIVLRINGNNLKSK